MFCGELTHELCQLTQAYRDRFNDIVGTMQIRPDVTTEQLTARIKQALADNRKIYISDRIYMHVPGAEIAPQLMRDNTQKKTEMKGK